MKGVVVQNKINILTDLIQKSGLKLTQKKLAFDIISDIVLKYNLKERDLQRRVKKDINFVNEFIDYFDRVVTLNALLGINETDIFSLDYKYTNWVLERQNNYEINKQLDFISLQKLFEYIRLYEMAYDKMPESMNILKSFILEPMELEKDFDTVFTEALKQFKKDLRPNEILQVGWAKQILNKIVVKK